MTPAAILNSVLPPSSELLIDSNLLLLLIMGRFDSSLIGRWKRLNMFTIEDFDCLRELIRQAKVLVVTSHVLTEVSNLANSLPLWQKADWSKHFRNWILTGLEERHVRAVDVASHDVFSHFGLTDAALFRCSEKTYVLTVDERLAAYLQSHHRRVINFNHLRTWLLP